MGDPGNENGRDWVLRRSSPGSTDMHLRADLPCQAGSFQRWPPGTPGEHTAPRQPRKKGEAKGVELDLEGTIDGSPAPVQTERHWCTTAGPGGPLLSPLPPCFLHPPPPALCQKEDLSSNSRSRSEGTSFLQPLSAESLSRVLRVQPGAPGGPAGCLWAVLEAAFPARTGRRVPGEAALPAPAVSGAGADLGGWTPISGSLMTAISSAFQAQIKQREEGKAFAHPLLRWGFSPAHTMSRWA